jgi:hypothetical protein
VIPKGPFPLLVLAVFISTLASANSAPVNTKLLHSATNILGGYYTYPYYFSINGGTVTPMMTKNVTSNSDVMAIDRNALSLAASAPASEFTQLALYTPAGATPDYGPQEFIGYRTTAMAAPESGTLILISTGLLGIGALVRYKRHANRRWFPNSALIACFKRRRVDI